MFNNWKIWGGEKLIYLSGPQRWQRVKLRDSVCVCVCLSVLGRVRKRHGPHPSTFFNASPFSMAQTEGRMLAFPCGWDCAEKIEDGRVKQDCEMCRCSKPFSKNNHLSKTFTTKPVFLHRGRLENMYKKWENGNPVITPVHTLVRMLLGQHGYRYMCAVLQKVTILYELFCNCLSVMNLRVSMFL